MVLLMVLFGFLLAGPVAVQGHPKQVQVTGDYEITYFSDPLDPIAGSQATLFIQVRDVTSGTQLRVYHFLVEMIPPDGRRLIQHPTSNSTTFTFDRPGNWILLFEIGLTDDLLIFDASAIFLADISRAQTSGLLTAFFEVLVSAIPRSYERWGHIFAVVLWMGTMLHVVSTYWSSSGERTGLSNFARTYRQADFVVAFAVGLLILTGVLRAFDHGLTPLTLFELDFGLVLFAKILLAAGMIAIGLFNRTYLLRNLERAVGSSQPLASGQVELSDRKIGVLAKRIYYLTIVEMGLGVSAILFGTVFTQIHTIA